MLALPVVDDDVPDPFFAALMAGVDLLEVADLLDPPPWMSDALCREFPDVDFFPPRGEPTEPAKDVCRRCLCRAECLMFALEHHERGIWGATSEKQRKKVLKGRLSVADVLAALDARTGSQRVTAAVEPDACLAPMGAVPEPIGSISEPGVEKARCPSCEAMFTVDELDAGGWCRQCWP